MLRSRLLVARRRGEKKQDSANEILLTAVLFIMIAAVISSVAFVFFASAIIDFCGSTADTHADAVAYFSIIMGGMIFNCIQMGINAAQRGAGNTKITMRTNVTSNTINIILNYLLINGHFGFPPLGIRGAALATVSGTVVACIMSVASIFRKDSFLSIPYIIEQHIRPTVTAFLNLIKVAYSVFFEQVLMRIGFMLTAIMAADQGTDAMAAHQVGMNIMALSFAFGDGLQATAVALIGRSLGAGDPDLAKEYGRTCRLIGAVIAVCLVAIYYFGASSLYHLFFIGRPHCRNWSPDYACHNLCCHFPDLPGHLHGMPTWCRRHALHCGCIHDKRHFHPYHHFLFLWLCPRLGNHRYLDGRTR